MAKKKKNDRSAQSAHRLRLNGLTAFRRGDYDEALDAWERATELVPNQQPTEIMAEAYFRRAMKQLPDSDRDYEAVLVDLNRAGTLKPKDPLYRYHLALSYHRQGDVETAVTHYQSLFASDNTLKERLAYPLCLALLQQGKDPDSSPAWKLLTSTEQSMLSHANAFRRRPYVMPEEAPSLWRGLAALDEEAVDQARQHLADALADPNTPYEESLAHYYLGVLAAHEEDWLAASRSWVAARQAGLNRSRLAGNMGELYHRLAEERLQAGNTAEALTAAKEARRYTPDDGRLQTLLAHIHQQLGYQAAGKAKWEEARSHFEAAQELDGGNFRLAYNLALIYEREEDFEMAGDAWREALRRRPRRDDHPDALSEQQIAQLWRRCANAYSQAGEYDEAVQVYRNAVKWSPDNIEIRLALAEGLQLNGQEQASQNELERILQRDPQNIPALLRIGELLAHSHHWWHTSGVTRYWQKVLEIDPDNFEARQMLVDYFIDRSDHTLYWGDDEAALDYLQKALTYQPDNGEVLARIAGIYIRSDREDEAHPYIEQALQQAGSNPDIYGELIQSWLVQEEPEKALALAEQMEAQQTADPTLMYIHMGRFCAEQMDDNDVARLWLDRALEKTKDPLETLRLICYMTSIYALDLTPIYVKKARAMEEIAAEADYLAGLAAFRQGNEREAKRWLHQAERRARRERNVDLLEQIKDALDMINDPLGRLLNSPLGRQLDPDIPPEELIGMLAHMIENDPDFDMDDLF